jgi:hypothetical protein
MRYVLEVVQVLEGEYLNWGLGWLSSPPYPDYGRGREIRNGVPLEGSDLWFREGIYATVPTEHLTWGMIKALYAGE